MQGLQTLINHLSDGKNIHISILDLCGILNAPLARIDFNNIIHSKRFCDLAKSTEKGYRVCLRCKMLANQKAVSGKEPFEGHCLYGLYEVGYPVVIGCSVAAIIYVGNAVVSEEKTLERIKKVCGYTGADTSELLKELPQCEYIDDSKALYEIAEILSDYIKLICQTSTEREPKLHWLVAVLKQYADEMYCTSITLGELAKTYQKNEKYMGRLFKREMGISFNEYCMELRMNKAEKMLISGKEKIIDISLECGFNNISYFNRVFQKKYGMSPSTYRMQTK